MAKFPGFIGPHNRLRSPTFDAEVAINLYLERAGAGTPKADPAYYVRPALGAFAYAGAGPIRALFGQDGRCFAVSGSSFGEVNPGATFTAIGTVAVDGQPATISSSGDQGHQLFITAGKLGYIYDLTAGTFAQITDADFPDYALQGLYFDGSFIVLDGDTGAFQLSALLDGTDWNGLDIGIESQFSDRIIAMTRTHDNLWLFGTKNTAPWYNSGATSSISGAPVGAAGLVPVPGSLVEHGTASPWACVEVDNAPMWLGQDAQGSYSVWRANGYTPVRVSTHAVEWELQKVGSLSSAIAFAFQQLGHTFYVLYVPGLDYSLVYDLATEEWFLWSHWDTRIAHDLPLVSVNHAFIWGKHLVGDRQSGGIYDLSFAYARDEVVLA